MKVLVVGTGGSVVSGISSAADQMVRTLAELGVDAERLVTGSARRRSPSKLNVENIQAAVTDAVSVFRAARRWRSDVVWYHTFGVPTLAALRSVAVAVAARLAGARPITHVHAYGLEDWLRDAGCPLRASLLALDRASENLFVLYDGAAHAVESTVHARSVGVLPMWVDVPAEIESIPRSHGVVRVVFVGGLIERKGIDQLLGAARILQAKAVQVEFHLAGSADEDGPGAQQRLAARAADLVEAGLVRFEGEVGPSAVRALLRRADLFVLPSRAEGLPLAMLEAMSEGVPVIVGDAGDIRRLVEATGCGRVLASVTAQDIAQAIEDLAADTEARVAAAQAGRATVYAMRRDAIMRLSDILRATSTLGEPSR